MVFNPDWWWRFICVFTVLWHLILSVSLQIFRSVINGRFAACFWLDLWWFYWQILNILPINTPVKMYDGNKIRVALYSKNRVGILVGTSVALTLWLHFFFFFNLFFGTQSGNALNTNCAVRGSSLQSFAHWNSMFRSYKAIESQVFSLTYRNNLEAKRVTQDSCKWQNEFALTRYHAREPDSEHCPDLDWE